MSQSRSAAEIENWIIGKLAEALKTDPSQISPDVDLPSLALDSMKAVELSAELSKCLGKPVPPTILWDHANIRELARALSA